MPEPTFHQFSSEWYAAREPELSPRTGRRNGESNIRNRLLAKAVERANARLTEDGGQPLPDGTTPLAAADVHLDPAGGRADPRYVMSQVGHTDPSMTLRVHAQVIRSNRDHGREVDELVGAADWAPMGTNGGPEEAAPIAPPTPERENPLCKRASGESG
jgi:hypothetical protein